MKVVAIVVSYNGLKWYQKCFDSLLNSSIAIDVVVVDNKSSDNTLDFIRNNYPQITLIESNINLGFGKANNIGFKYALEKNADFVFLLNQDAWVQINTIELLIKEMQESPEYGLISPIHLTGSEKKLDHNFSLLLSPTTCPDFLSDLVVQGKADNRIYPIAFVNAALWLLSRKCIETVGGFDPIFPHYGEDNNYIDRLEYHGFQRGIYPRVYGIHDRECRNSLLTKKQKSDRELVNYLISLTRLQSPYRILFLKSIFRVLVDMSRNLIQFSFSDSLINLKSLRSIICLTPKILKNRKLSKMGRCSFLK